MTLLVRCSNCEAVYETAATEAAVREVGRCQECGEQALTIAEEEVASEDTAAD